MSQTNALRKTRPIVQPTESKPSATAGPAPGLSRNPDPKAKPGLDLDASEIARLRAFFELLDQWDRNETRE